MFRAALARLAAAALALVCLASAPAPAAADTVVYIGQCGVGAGAQQVVPVKWSDTGCPDSGSWDVGVLSIGTDGTLCYCTVAGSPGTWVDVGGASSVSALNDLSDVTITSAATGEVIKYSGSAWVDGSIDGSDVGLADSPGSDGAYTLTRSSGVNSWTAAVEDLGDLSSVSLGSALNGEVLRYTGGTWYNNKIYLADTQDLAGVTPNDGDVLTYSTGDGFWVPEAASGGSGMPVWTTAATQSAQGLTSTPATITGCSHSVTADSVGDMIEAVAIIYVTANPNSRTFDLTFKLDGVSVGGGFTLSAGIDSLLIMKGRWRITTAGVSGEASGYIERMSGSSTLSFGGFNVGSLSGFDTSAAMTLELTGALNTDDVAVEIRVLEYSTRAWTPAAP